METIAQEAAKKFGEGGPITLSFGLLLIFLIWNSVQQGKAAEKASAAADLKAAAAEERAEKARTVYQTHVELFTSTTVKATQVMENSTRVTESVVEEIRDLSNTVNGMSERLQRVETEVRKG